MELKIDTVQAETMSVLILRWNWAESPFFYLMMLIILHMNFEMGNVLNAQRPRVLPKYRIPDAQDVFLLFFSFFSFQVQLQHHS